MATKTDLSGFLRADEGNVLTSLEDWLLCGDPRHPGEPPHLPAKLRVLYRAPGAGSDEAIIELPIEALPTSGAPLVDRIESEIIKRLGPNPMGRLRVRAWGQGSASTPGLDVTRTISTIDESADVALYRAEIARKDRENASLREQNTQLALGAQSLAASLAGSVANLATTRTAGSAAADMGGISGLLGMLGLVIFRPHLEAALRGESGPLQQLGDRLLTMLLPPPPGQPSPARMPTPAEVHQALQDPRARRMIADTMRENVPGIDALLEAAAGAKGSPAPPPSPPDPAVVDVEAEPVKAVRPPASASPSNPSP